MTKAYSHNEEDYTTDFSDMLTQWAEEADLAVGMPYWEVEVSELAHSEIITNHRVMSFLEDLDQHAFDEVGECFDNDYSGVSIDALKELRTLIQGWADKHVNIGQYFVLLHNTEVKRELTEEDLLDLNHD